MSPGLSKLLTDDMQAAVRAGLSRLLCGAGDRALLAGEGLGKSLTSKPHTLIPMLCGAGDRALLAGERR